MFKRPNIACPPSFEDEIGKTAVSSRSARGKQISRPFSKTIRAKLTGGVAQAIEYLL
jgi:hypothetical protein